MTEPGVVLASLASDRLRLDGVIAEFCHAVAAEPLCYFSEADLQGMLYARMVSAFPAQVETSCNRGPDSKGRYRTGVVHREYGAGGSRRIDIALFSEKDVAAISGPNLKLGSTYMKPRFVIELGTEKTVDTAAHIASDLEKLSQATERGYLIHFYRDASKADSGTATRAKTEQRLEAVFRRPVGAAGSHNKVRSLCFLLRIARSSKTIHGKCELFNAELGEWRKVNLGRVREAVLETLR